MRREFRMAALRIATQRVLIRVGGALLCATGLAACVSGASADLVCANTSREAPLTGSLKGNVTVPKNATCFMRADVAGDVTALEGSKVYVLEGTKISGAFRAIGASVVRFNLDDAPRVARGGANSVTPAAPAPIQVGGNLVVKESRLIGESGIAATDVGGNLIIARNSDGGGIAAPASLGVCTPGFCRAELAVKVAKSVKIKQNHIAVAIANTSIGADLKCTSNDKVPVVMKQQGAAGNLAIKGRRSGQCEHMPEVVYSGPRGKGAA